MSPMYYVAGWCQASASKRWEACRGTARITQVVQMDREFMCSIKVENVSPAAVPLRRDLFSSPVSGTIREAHLHSL